MIAYAHSEDIQLVQDPLLKDQLELSIDPTLICFMLLAVIFGLSLKKSKRQVVSPAQVVSFYGGVVVIMAMLNPVADDLASQLFFAHMIQHLAIMLIGVPMILCGAPFFVLIRWLPSWPRRYIYLPILRVFSVLSSLTPRFFFAVVSLILFNVNFWLWHQPTWYDWALYNDLVHILEHACMALAALFFWRYILDPHPLKSPLPMGLRVVFLACFMALNLILAAMLTYASEPWYAYDNIPTPPWWDTWWDRLDDQRLGGLIMWVPGSIITFLYMSACFFIWVSREHQQPSFAHSHTLLNEQS